MQEQLNTPAQNHRDHGFTLIEVMVVIVILGILAAFIVPKIMDRPDAARITKAKQDIRTIESALRLYRLDNHRYPTSEEGLISLTTKPADAPNWKEDGYLDRLPKDPWGKEYIYQNPGAHLNIDIYTMGADGAEGGQGINADIGNWNIE